MNNIDKIIGSRIKIERSRLNIEQKDLAEKVGISNKTISKYELGNAKPSIEVLIKLANIFDCSS